MYFHKDKKNTNIDKEFKNNSILSQILNTLNKYKIIIFIGLALLILILVIILFIKNKDTNYIVLNGEKTITIYQGSDYIEAGYSAHNSNNIDLTTEVIVKSTVDTNKIGEYKITYTIGNKTKKRIVKVIEKPEEYTYIYLKTVNNDKNVYLKVGQTYKEPGYQVYNSSGKNLNQEVKVTGTVDTNKKGNYKLIYSIIDSKNVTVSVTRTVVVE